MNKAKRVITSFDFEEEGASVHLVSKKQGGAANGFTTLIKKSNKTSHLPETEDISIEKKLEQIKVTMSMEEFLRKFFRMWYDDAELLTAMLGYQTEYEAYLESDESEPYDHSDYLASKLESFEVMKSMHEGDYSKTSALDYVNILGLQEKLENNEEMMDKITIEKSRFAELEDKEKDLVAAIDVKKALESKVEALEAELSDIKKAQEDAKLADIKIQLKDLVAEDKVESIAKSLLVMDKDAAQTMIDTLSASAKKVEESDLFVEKSVEGEVSNEEAHALAMKKAYDQALANA